MADHTRKLPAAPAPERERRGSYLIGRVAGPEANHLLEALWPEPELLFSRGATIQSPWQSAATDKVVVCVQGESYFLKRYNCLGWSYRLKNVLRKSRGQKSWEAAWLFQRLGIPTPLPLLWLEERRWRLLGPSILVFPHFSNSRSLLDYWPEAPAGRRQQILDAAASVIGRMHRSGVLHGDLNWRNLLVREGSKGPELFLVDLDGYRYGRPPTPEQAEKDLSHFLRDLDRSGGDEATSDQFLQSWRQNFLPE